MACKLEVSSLVDLFQKVKPTFLEFSLPALRLACVYQ